MTEAYDEHAGGRGQDRRARRMARERYRSIQDGLAGLTDAQRICLMLQTAGASYERIREITGFSLRKVERSVLEGRRGPRGLGGAARLGRGVRAARRDDRAGRLRPGDCEGAPGRLPPRPALRHCRATLRDRRESNEWLAALVPVGAPRRPGVRRAPPTHADDRLVGAGRRRRDGPGGDDGPDGDGAPGLGAREGGCRDRRGRGRRGRGRTDRRRRDPRPRPRTPRSPRSPAGGPPVRAAAATTALGRASASRRPSRRRAARPPGRRRSGGPGREARAAREAVRVASDDDPGAQRPRCRRPRPRCPRRGRGGTHAPTGPAPAATPSSPAPTAAAVALEFGP